jgi:uncharacterized membrane protein YphA (DoxX/SURF4 family)
VKTLLPTFLQSPAARSRLAWTALRLTLAGLIAAHGWARFIAGGVLPFGTWLTGQGLPLGLQLAIAITAFEIAGTVLLALIWKKVPAKPAAASLLPRLLRAACQARQSACRRGADSCRQPARC